MTRVDTVVGLRSLLSFASHTPSSFATPSPRAPPQVRELLAKGANIEAVDKDGRTALHNAASRGHDAVVRARTRGGHIVSRVNHRSGACVDRIALYGKISTVPAPRFSPHFARRRTHLHSGKRHFLIIFWWTLKP